MSEVTVFHRSPGGFNRRLNVVPQYVVRGSDSHKTIAVNSRPQRLKQFSFLAESRTARPCNWCPFEFCFLTASDLYNFLKGVNRLME